MSKKIDEAIAEIEKYCVISPIFKRYLSALEKQGSKIDSLQKELDTYKKFTTKGSKIYINDVECEILGYNKETNSIEIKINHQNNLLKKENNNEKK